MDHAATMSLCSALKWLNLFGWDDNSRIRAFTILRHPGKWLLSVLGNIKSAMVVCC